MNEYIVYITNRKTNTKQASRVTAETKFYAASQALENARYENRYADFEVYEIIKVSE